MKYNIVNGTAYHKNTKPEVTRLLERFRNTGERIRIWYGENGKCWHDEYYTIGRIGRSLGQYKIPLLIHNERSLGGPGILEDCIVRIDINRNGIKETVYCEDNIQFNQFITSDDGIVLTDTGDVYAKCKDNKASKRLAAFMNGERWSK